jgi:hypothetical protein
VLRVLTGLLVLEAVARFVKLAVRRLRGRLEPFDQPVLDRVRRPVAGLHLQRRHRLGLLCSGRYVVAGLVPVA